MKWILLGVGVAAAVLIGVVVFLSIAKPDGCDTTFRFTLQQLGRDSRAARAVGDQSAIAAATASLDSAMSSYRTRCGSSSLSDELDWALLNP